MSVFEVHSLFPHSQSEVHGAAQTCFNRSASPSRHQRETSVAADGSTCGPKRMGIERPGMKLDLAVVNCMDSDSSFHLPECHSFICEMAVVTLVPIPSHDCLGGCIHSMYVILDDHQSMRMDPTWRVLCSLGHCISKTSPIGCGSSGSELRSSM